jgi:hypothetical protein
MFAEFVAIVTVEGFSKMGELGDVPVGVVAAASV